MNDDADLKSSSTAKRASLKTGQIISSYLTEHHMPPYKQDKNVTVCFTPLYETQNFCKKHDC